MYETDHTIPAMISSAECSFSALSGCRYTVENCNTGARKTVIPCFHIHLEIIAIENEVAATFFYNRVTENLLEKT